MLLRTRSFLFTTLLATAVLAGRAQGQSLSFGLMAGGSLSTFTGNLAADVKNNATFLVGGFAHASLAGFSVEPGLFYTEKGAKIGTTGPTETTQKLNYIQIPLVVRVTLPLGLLKLYVGGGPAIGVNIGCNFAPTAGGAATDCADAGSGFGGAESTEISVIGNAGIVLGKLSLGLRYDGGLTNSFKGLVNQTEKPDLKTRTISAVAAIRF